MGRSQVVRQRFLIPPPVGSNPAAPTNPRRILSAYFNTSLTQKYKIKQNIFEIKIVKK